MQPELPWNVAGIPPETREAVRAAARREGLSLGEWMTRQIVGGFPDAVNGSAGNAPAGIPEDSMAAAESVAQIGVQVNAFAERLSRVEQQVQTGSMREAVKALHQGLSRAAEDITEAANKSDRRLDNIEQRLSGIVSRLEQTERANASAIGHIEQSLRELAARVEAVSGPQSVSSGPTTSAAASADESGNSPSTASHDAPSSASVGEAFAASEGFLEKPTSFLGAARLAANAAETEGKSTAAENGEALSAWFYPKRAAAIASVFAVTAMAAFGGVALTGGKSSTAHAVPAGPVSQLHSASAAAPYRRTAATAERHGGSPPAQITATIKADVAAVLPSASVGAMPSSNTAAAPPAGAAAVAVSAAAPSSPEQRIVALANAGNPRAQLLLGAKYLEGNGTQVNEAEAARWLARAAQQGEPLAQYRLGTLYERGRGVPADAQLATHWYGLAAAQGNRKAMHNLAVAFAEGSGTPKNESLAAVWFARAANLGLADSQFNLAVLYERGMGVKQSLENAYRWYLIAAAQGDTESKSRAEALATQLKDSERGAAQKAAAVFRQQPLTPAANSLPVLG